ncbi:unnamed protein product [Scytosiphon promiscuus]
MDAPWQPRPWLPPLLVTVALLVLFSDMCLAWQLPASSTQVFHSPRQQLRPAPFLSRERPTWRRRRASTGDPVNAMNSESEVAAQSHGALVEGLLALTGDPLEKVQEGGRIVVFRGNPSARLMLVGEAPGAEEDKLGVPFVGRSGQLLDTILRAVGLDPDRDVYISNIVRRRPLDNRTPTPEEMDYYLPFLLEEIRLVDPDIIVTLGASSTKALLPFETRGITKARGQWADLDALGQVHGGVLQGRLVMPWFHPSYLIRNAGERSRQEGGVRWHTRNDVREVLNAMRFNAKHSSP